MADSYEGDEARIERTRELHGDVHGPEYWRTLRDVFRRFADQPERELPFRPADLARLAVPAFVLHGDRDAFFPVGIATTMYQSLPDAELAILPNVGHGAPSEATDLFVGMVRAFLERRGAG